MGYERLFQDFYSVGTYVLGQLRTIFMSFYETSRFSFLFNMALLPIILFIAFDILFSFVLSIRLRRFVFFNVVSARSWSALKLQSQSNRLKPPTASVRYSQPSHLVNKLRLKYKLYKNKDGAVKKYSFDSLKRFNVRDLVARLVKFEYLLNKLVSVAQSIAEKHNNVDNSTDSEEVAKDE